MKRIFGCSSEHEGRSNEAGPDLLCGFSDDALDKAALGELHLPCHPQLALPPAGMVAGPLHSAVEGSAIRHLRDICVF